jgi:hypothetical protein
MCAKHSLVGKTSILQSSVSDANVLGVRKYIANQEEHHRTKSFDDEFEGFMNAPGFRDSGIFKGSEFG